MNQEQIPIKEYIHSKKDFLEMYNHLPIKARNELVYNFAINPMTVDICYLEIINNTKLSKKILKELGYDNEPAKQKQHH